MGRIYGNATVYCMTCASPRASVSFWRWCRGGYGHGDREKSPSPQSAEPGSCALATNGPLASSSGSIPARRETPSLACHGLIVMHGGILTTYTYTTRRIHSNCLDLDTAAIASHRPIRPSRQQKWCRCRCQCQQRIVSCACVLAAGASGVRLPSLRCPSRPV